MDLIIQEFANFFATCTLEGTDDVYLLVSLLGTRFCVRDDCGIYNTRSRRFMERLTGFVNVI